MAGTTKDYECRACVGSACTWAEGCTVLAGLALAGKTVPTPPAPGEAREDVCRWCGEPDAAHLFAENDESSCLLTLRARAEAAERARDEMNRLREQNAVRAETLDRQRREACERHVAAESHVARLTDALREFADERNWWRADVLRDHGGTSKAWAWNPMDHPFEIARAALAPAPEPTPTETDR